MSRLKIYYPDWQITKNLYTNGGEYTTEDGIEYVGYYHKYTTGEVYSESNWSPLNSIKLKTLSANRPVVNTVYENIKSISIDELKAPLAYSPILSIDDYYNGDFNRYFVVRRNNLNQIVEVNKTEFDKLSNSRGVDGNLYTGLIINWKLTGPRNDVYENSTLVEKGVIDQNIRSIQATRKYASSMFTYLTDMLEYSIYWPLTSEEIKKKFV
jgi:hypothetical protein